MDGDTVTDFTYRYLEKKQASKLIHFNVSMPRL